MEQIVLSFLGSQNSLFVEHLLHECDLIGKILATEKNPTLAFDIGKVNFLDYYLWRILVYPFCVTMYDILNGYLFLRFYVFCLFD